MKRKFNLGKLVFEHILEHTENVAYKKVLRYPSLIYGIQKPNLVTPTDILGPPVIEMHINHKLYDEITSEMSFHGKRCHHKRQR